MLNDEFIWLDAGRSLTAEASFSIAAFSFGAGNHSYESFFTDEESGSEPWVGMDAQLEKIPIASFSLYFIVGISGSIEFNNKHFMEGVTDIWRKDTKTT